MPNNTIEWGQGAANNSIGWGAGAVNNNLNWGKIHAESYGHDETNLVGVNLRFAPILKDSPILSGTFEVGETVSCSTGRWNSGSSITYTYQWKRNGVNIQFATNSTYLIDLDDDTETLTCEVTATNAIGIASALSNAELVGSNWILRLGAWDDTGVWEDSSVWID